MINHYDKDTGGVRQMGFQRTRQANNRVPPLNTSTQYIMLSQFVICDEQMEPRKFPTYSEASKFLDSKRQLKGRARVTRHISDDSKRIKVYG